MNNTVSLVWGVLSELSNSDIIASFALVVSITSVFANLFFNRLSIRREKLTILFQLHEVWWSPEMMHMRSVVWEQRELWRSQGQDSPAIRHYSRRGPTWSLTSDESRSHNRILFFFADINRLVELKVVDLDVALELFGTSHFSWFDDYFCELIDTIEARQPSRTPRFVGELRSFSKKVKGWEKKRRP